MVSKVSKKNHVSICRVAEQQQKSHSLVAPKGPSAWISHLVRWWWCLGDSPRGCSYELSCVPTDASSPFPESFPESLLVLLVLLLLKVVNSRFPITISCHIPRKRKKRRKRGDSKKGISYGSRCRLRGQKLWRGKERRMIGHCSKTGLRRGL